MCTRRSVADKSHLEVQATAWRELAKRARRLAGTLLDDPARDRLLDYSTELEEKAAQLEVDVRSTEPPAVADEPQRVRKSSDPK
jgi:hypothetical protein